MKKIALRMRHLAFVFAFLLAASASAQHRFHLQNANRLNWDTANGKLAIGDWGWHDETLQEFKWIVDELKALPDEPELRLQPASFDTSAYTFRDHHPVTEFRYWALLHEFEIDTGNGQMRQGQWVFRRGIGERYVHLRNSDADAKGWPRGIVKLPACFDLADLDGSYTERIKTLDQFQGEEITEAQYDAGYVSPSRDIISVMYACRTPPASISLQSTLDGCVTESGSSCSATSQTVAAGTDLCMFASGTSADDGDFNIISISWDGEVLNEAIARSNDILNAEAWSCTVGADGCPNVTATGTFTVTAAESQFMVAGNAWVLENCDQTEEVDASNSAIGTSAAPSVNVTTITANGMLFDAVAIFEPSAATAGAGQTDAGNWTDGNGRMAVSRETTTTTGSYTMSWSSGNDDWTIVAAHAKAAAVGAVVFPLVNADPTMGLVNGGLTR